MVTLWKYKVCEIDEFEYLPLTSNRKCEVAKAMANQEE